MTGRLTHTQAQALLRVEAPRRPMVLERVGPVQDSQRWFIRRQPCACTDGGRIHPDVSCTACCATGVLR